MSNKYRVIVVPAERRLGEDESQVMSVTVPEGVEAGAIAVALRRASDDRIISDLSDFMAWVKVAYLTEPDETDF